MRREVVRRIATVGLTFSLLTGGVATAAIATAAPAGCPSGHGCAWKDRDYKTAGTTKAATFEYYISDFRTLLGTWDNQTTSIFNNGNSGMQVMWYTDVNYGGSRLALNKGKGVPRLNETQPLFNDRISSARFE